MKDIIRHMKIPLAIVIVLMVPVAFSDLPLALFTIGACVLVIIVPFIIKTRQMKKKQKDSVNEIYRDYERRKAMRKVNLKALLNDESLPKRKWYSFWK